MWILRRSTATLGHGSARQLRERSAEQSDAMLVSPSAGHLIDKGTNIDATGLRKILSRFTPATL
jgi:hypothetical protein